MSLLAQLLAEDGVALQGSGSNKLGRCPFHQDTGPSFSVDVVKGVYYCHGCHVRGNARTYLEQRRGLAPFEATAYVNEHDPSAAGAGPAPAPDKPAKVYASLPRSLWVSDRLTVPRIGLHEYRDTENEIVLVVCRYANLPDDATDAERDRWRKCDQRRPNPQGKGWIAKGLPPDQPHPVYRLPELAAAAADQQVMVVEGEKCADAVAAAFGRAVVTTWCGGSALVKIDHTDWSPLHGRPVLLVADEDAVGRKAMLYIAERLAPHGGKIRLALPPGETKDDIADWLERGGQAAAVEQLQHLATDAPAAPAEPGPPDADVPHPGDDDAPPDLPAGDDTPRHWISGLTKVGLGEALAQVKVRIRWNVRSGGMEIDRGHGYTPINKLSQDDLREHIRSTCRIPSGQGEKPALFTRETWDRCRNAVLYDLQVDPFVDWLESLPKWDDEARIDGLIHILWGVESDVSDDLVCWASRYPFIGAIQRAYVPGDEIHEFPIFVGAQGAGKSAYLKHLLPARSGWYGNTVDLAADVKNLVEQLQGVAIAEVGEMAGLRRADVENVKATITRSVDQIRLAFRPDPELYPRRAVFVGTANPGGTIVPNDLSGNRRFVPIDLKGDPSPDPVENGQCLIGPVEPFIEEHRAQLWAEALHRHRGGLRANLPRDLKASASAAAETHRSGNERLEAAIEQLEEERPGAKLSMEEIMDAIKLIDSAIVGDPSKPLQNEIAGVLKTRGWRANQKKTIRPGVRRRSWLVPG